MSVIHPMSIIDLIFVAGSTTDLNFNLWVLRMTLDGDMYPSTGEDIASNWPCDIPRNPKCKKWDKRNDCARLGYSAILMESNYRLVLRPVPCSALILHPHYLSLLPRINVQHLTSYITTPALTCEKQDALCYTFRRDRPFQRNPVIPLADRHSCLSRTRT